MWDSITSKNENSAEVEKRKLELESEKMDKDNVFKKAARKRGEWVTMMLNSLALLLTLIKEDYVEQPNIYNALEKAAEQFHQVSIENEELKNELNGKS